MVTTNMAVTAHPTSLESRVSIRGYGSLEYYLYSLTEYIEVLCICRGLLCMCHEIDCHLMPYAYL